MDLQRLTSRPLQLPDSTRELQKLFEDQCSRLSKDSQEFHDLLRQLVPTLHVYLVRLIDGGHPQPRARVTLRLDALASDASRVDGLPELLTQHVTVDLSEPPQREKIREAAVAFARQNVEPRQIAAALRVTKTALYRSLALQRKMISRSLTTPYEMLHEPPAGYDKLRRYQNLRYRFEKTSGYEPPSI